MIKTGRDTQTGGVLERILCESLAHGGYQFEGPVDIGARPQGSRHRIDKLVTTSDGRKILISAKWQQSSGSVQEKIPYEVICLADAVKKSGGAYSKAYLVVAGNGMSPKLKEWYLSGGLKEFILYEKEVEIVGLEEFMARANLGRL